MYGQRQGTSCLGNKKWFHLICLWSTERVQRGNEVEQVDMSPEREVLCQAKELASYPVGEF